MKIAEINFPEYSDIRCLMMPYIQGEPSSVPDEYDSYRDIIRDVYIKQGDVGYLTIDESKVKAQTAQRAERAKYRRAIHTEAGRNASMVYGWGDGGGWGSSHKVTLDEHVSILLANSIDDTCAVWDAKVHDTSIDGDIGDRADEFPYEHATFMKAGEVFKIGILTPHESLTVEKTTNRQFIRIVSSGVHGRETYFTENPLMSGVNHA